MSRPEELWGRQELGELLQELDRLRWFTRAVRHGFWLPLVLLGLLMMGATPLYFRPGDPTLPGAPAKVVFKDGSGTPHAGYVPLCHAVHGIVAGCKPATPSVVAPYFPSGITTTSPRAIAIYWLIALPLAYVIVAAWAHRRGLRRGVATPMLAYAVTGIGLVALLVLADVLSGTWSTAVQVSSVGRRGLAALFVIAVGLPVLAYREQSREMWAFSLGFLGYATLINLYDIDNVTERLGLSVGPEVGVFLGGLFTLLAGLAFAVKQQQQQVS